MSETDPRKMWEGCGCPTMTPGGWSADRRPAEGGRPAGVPLDGLGSGPGGDVGPTPASAGATRGPGLRLRLGGASGARLDRRRGGGMVNPDQGGALDGSSGRGLDLE